MKKIVIFASGSGSNAENIISYFKDKSEAGVVAVFCNNPNAKVLERAAKFGVPSSIFDKTQLVDGTVLEMLKKIEPDLIVLAGFLLIMPESIVAHFPEKIINVHPALLPKYGGKGMYGMHVHRTIFNNKELETGISIHYVNEHYDEGAVIFQATTDITNLSTPEEIAAKVRELEHRHFPEVIARLLND